VGQIVVLDENMVNMIAAGEVIERPANVVKELMENSIDAGATKITVSVEDGGRKLISVADNGCGMDAEDLGRAFEPHTTSKIRTSKDLLGISTLGFRGEALASIAAVAQVKAVSRVKDRPQANCLEIDCGKRGRIGPASADVGTTIQVRDIFYKLPARRKFLRTANTEMGHISEHFIRIALANDNLDMALISNERELYRLSAGQTVRQRIAELFSPEMSESLMETESAEKGLHISALLGKPGDSRTSNKFQYVFLNGRFIRDRFISHAIKEAYRGLLDPNRFPVVFLFIQMPYEDYDVNVHPTKTEVRFYNVNLVHSQVLGCLREKLLSTNLETQARLPIMSSTILRDTTSSAGQRSQKIADAMADFFKRYKPIRAQQQFAHEPAGRRPKARYETPTTEYQRLRLPQKFLQIHDSFIVTQTDDGFIIIDQHALHERILYENLRERLRESKLESQRLLIPESFQITEAQAEVLKTSAGLMEKLGIELVPFGPRTYAIQGFPTLLAKVPPVGFVQDLVDLLDRKETELDADGLLDEILKMAACKAAVKAGQKLSDAEIEQLLAEKERTERTSHCPHGRPTTIKFSINELERQFKRT